ncbi:MAG: hypothetical protein H7343_11400 [Undibacterium sp.]|nr:hypothetical protein [Opitutaceae bacterium]
MWVFAALTLPICAHATGLAVPQLFARFACGGPYWFAGLAVVRSQTPPARDRSNWPVALLTADAVWMVSPLRGICLEWGLYHLAWPTPVSPHRLDFLPAALWILLPVTGRAPYPRLDLARADDGRAGVPRLYRSSQRH